MKTPNKVILIIIVIGLSILFSFIVYRKTAFKPTIYKYGDFVHPISLRSMEGDAVNVPPDKWRLFILINGLEQNFSFIKYTDRLYQKFLNSGLEIFLFNSDEIEAIKEFRDINSISVPMLATKDNPLSVSQLFHSHSNERHVRLLDPAGKIVFISEFIQENDLRQVLERFLLGSVNYKNVTGITAKVGDTFADIESIAIEEKNDVILDKRFSPRVWIIFTSNCVSCALKSNLKMYGTIEEKILARLPLPKAVLFSPSFNIDDIDYRLNELNIKTPSFLAKGREKSAC